MQSLSNVPVKTFSIGFTETEYNEANYAKEIANYLGTDHTELYVTPEMAMAVIPKLAEIYDEPFSDSSQIPTYLVSRLARTQVSVSLSGDGGDELFGGYNRYSWGKSIWTRIHKIPKPIRKIVSKGMHTITPFYYDKLFSVISPILPTKYKQQLPGLKIQKLANILDSSTSKDLYSRLITHWKNPAKVVKGTTNTNDLYSRQFEVLDTDNFTHQMMYMDMQTFLTDDILTKVDRSSMSVGLEARVPFLDHRLIEFAWKVPLDMKIKNNQGKWLLRQVLYKYVPMEMIERPKMGFGIPIDSWLRGPLRAWADELLNKERIEAEGIFEYELIHKKWREHLNGKRNWAYHIWDILMFQCWYDKHKK
jgi:asparagine synthase (glutamine-hydrolysing)